MNSAKEILTRLNNPTINACLQGKITHDPDELKSSHLFLDKVINLFYPKLTDNLGYQTPWQKTKEHVVFRPHELSVWTGINGHGKSQFLGFLLLHFMQKGARVCIASLEMRPERLLMRLTRQVTAAALPDAETINKAHQWYIDKLWLFELVGSAKTDRLLEVFLHAHRHYGVDVFLLDSLLKCNIAEDDYNAQKIFIEKLCDFKNQYPCHIHVIAHPRKGMDETTIPGKFDIKGTGSISDLADNCFSIWRNKEKKSLHDPDCVWTCNKQRNGEWEGKVALWYDLDSFQYLETAAQAATPLITPTIPSD